MSHPTITAAATLDRSTVGTLVTDLDRELRQRPSRITIDLGAVDSFDSAGLGGVVLGGGVFGGGVFGGSGGGGGRRGGGGRF